MPVLTNPRRRSSYRRAFTLVEILVVLVILGIVSAMIIPQIGQRNDLIVATASRVVIADLTYAQNLAISSQKKIYVKFTGNTYSLYDAATLTTPITHPVNKGAYTVKFGDGSGGSYERVTIASALFGTRTTVGFDELGSPFGFSSPSTEDALVATGKIRLQAGTFVQLIEIQPYTGEATASTP